MDNRLTAQHEISLTLSSDLRWSSLLPNIVMSVAQMHGFSEHVASQILVATEEAVTNIIKHGYNQLTQNAVQISFTPLLTGLRIKITDQGIPYDPTEIQFDEETFSGLGNYLIGKLMDHVSYQNLGKKGHALVLEKYFPNSESVQAIIDQKVEEQPVKRKIEHQFSFRRAQPEDAIEIARCAYECYGYTYGYEHIYFPERVRALNESNDLVSIVAVAENGEIAGHIGLVKFDIAEGAYEVGLAMTKQHYRGGSIFSSLMHQALAFADTLNAKVLVAQCVTTHTYSQSQPLKMGMLPSALLPAYIPDDVTFKKIADEVVARTAILFVAKILHNYAPQPIYLAEEYLDLATEIYQQYGVKHTVLKTPADLVIGESSEVILKLAPNLQMGKLIVHEMGEDFTTVIKKQLHQIKREKIQVVETFVPLHEPWAISCVEHLRQLGFEFVGFLPATENGDWAILEYLNGIDANVEVVKVLPEAQFLYEYVQQQFELN